MLVMPPELRQSPENHTSVLDDNSCDPCGEADGTECEIGSPEYARLLALYLPQALFTHLEPHFERLGALAGGRLDELAAAADKNPPTLTHRTRTGIDEQRIEKHPAYVEMEHMAFGEYGLAALSHRGGVLGWPEPMPPAAKYALTYLFVQAEFGLCCPVSMTDSLTRTLRKFGAPVLDSPEPLITHYFPGPAVLAPAAAQPVSATADQPGPVRASAGVTDSAGDLPRPPRAPPGQRPTGRSCSAAIISLGHSR